MSIRLSASAAVTGELKESLHEAFLSATDKLEVKAREHEHRVVWDTATVSVESDNYFSVAKSLLMRNTTLTIEALCVEEPNDA